MVGHALITASENMSISSYDFSSLTPIQRMALADALYDSAMREIDAITPQLTAEQLAEIDRRIADVEAGQVDLMYWDDVYASASAREAAAPFSAEQMGEIHRRAADADAGNAMGERWETARARLFPHE